MIGELVRVPSVEALQEAAVDIFVSAAADAQRAGGLFNVVLSGGKTPEAVYSLLASAALFRSKVDWPRVQFFWGDERHVPPDHPDSNYRMVRAALLDRVPIDPSRVWRIKGEYPDASQAAAEYERDLGRAFAHREGQLPRFDLVLLGMGADGHTASLFPGTAALRERQRLAVANRVEALDTERITLTVTVLNNTSQVLFLVHGADKAGALKEVLEGPDDPERLPAQLIQPVNGRLRWLVDPAASHLLSV
jgi:6-phosphogluconolactonase